MVAEVNRNGINLYNEGQFDEALTCFGKAIQLFPKHIGLQLNVIQALVGKLRVDPSNQSARVECRDLLDSVSGQLDEEDAQYKRFTQLKNMVRTLSESA